MTQVPSENGSNSSAVDPVDDAITLSVLDAIQQLIEEREGLEQFVQQNFARLNELREQVRGETAGGEKELHQQVESMRVERDLALAQVESLTHDLRQARLSEQLAIDELGQARAEAEQNRRHSAEFQRLLSALRDDIAKKEQTHRAELERYAGMAKEHAELMEVVSGFEQLEAELRQEQEAVRKERERLQSAGSGVRAPAATPPGFLDFTCKYCGTKLQAKEHLAGLVTRCSQCAKMAPVPKGGAR